MRSFCIYVKNCVFSDKEKYFEKIESCVFDYVTDEICDTIFLSATNENELRLIEFVFEFRKCYKIPFKIFVLENKPQSNNETNGKSVAILKMADGILPEKTALEDLTFGVVVVDCKEDKRIANIKRKIERRGVLCEKIKIE